MIKLVNDTINKEDIRSLCEWLSTEDTPQLTKGKLTVELQDRWAEKIGTKYSVFVNSGSSAIFLTLSALQQMGRLKNNKIVVPSLSWHTDVSSPEILGMDVILCDCNLQDLSCDLEHLEQIFEKENPSSLILVSVLGLVPDMNRIVELCKKYDVLLLEDNCESAGSKYKDTYLGNFGLASFYSFYFGHHLSTIEGGFINTNDEELYQVLLSIRNHGWDRDNNEHFKNKLRDEWKITGFDSLYTFYYSGFNFRATDLQAFIGLRQIKNLESFSKVRFENFKTYLNNIKNNNVNIAMRENLISNFAFPIVSKNRNTIIDVLKNNNIECRPLIAGSMGLQPFWIKNHGITNLKNCDLIHKYGLYVPNNQNLTYDDIKQVCDLINCVI
jgi:CDP-6-deoxy-D-xylo-4-hexulose-3-dehydrase